MAYFGGQAQSSPHYYDPLGPNEHGKLKSPTGGPEMRQQIFGDIRDMQPQVQEGTQNYINYLQQAATDPSHRAEMGYYGSVLNGDYLHGSPELDTAMTQMRSAADQSTANQAAQVRSQYANNGMSFGTGNQEAQEAAGAANTASANQAEASARLQNYQQERGFQNTASAGLESSLSAPLNYLQQIPTAGYAPLTQEAQLVSGLTNGGLMIPTPYQTQGWGTQLMGGMGSM